MRTELSPLEEEFLQTLVNLEDVATSRQCGLATRQKDRARQRCRKLGYVVFAGGVWAITTKGKEALAEPAQ